MLRLGIASACVIALVAVSGCSDDGTDGAGGPDAAPAPSPTAVGDPARVEVLDEGAEPRATVRLGVDQGATASMSLTIDQRITTDGEVTDAPAFTFPFETEVTSVEDGVTASQTYGTVGVADTVSAAEAEDLRRSFAALDGTTDTLVLGADGAVAPSSSDDPTLTQLRTQLRSLVPVFPAAAVGVGATWTVTTVIEVDGVTVDQTATYTLESLDGDAYVVGVTVEQQYRNGEVEGVSVTAGRGTVSGRFEGSLGSALPTRSTADVSTQVSYDLGDTVTEVLTTVGLDLTTD